MRAPKQFANHFNALVEEKTRELATLKAARDIVTAMNGNGNGHQPSIMKIAEAAMQARGVTVPKRRGPKPGFRKAAADVAHVAQDVKIPEGLSLKGLDTVEAIAHALRAYRRPATSRELAALMQAGGYEVPEAAKTVPITRYIGIQAGHAVRAKVLKKSARGWALR